MSRRPRRAVAPLPRIALTLSDAAAAAGVDPELLKGQIWWGLLQGKRTSTPHWPSPYSKAHGGGRYLIGVDELGRWLAECGEAAEAGLWLGWE